LAFPQPDMIFIRRPCAVAGCDGRLETWFLVQTRVSSREPVFTSLESAF
jgi:hypothetical protein